MEDFIDIYIGLFCTLKQTVCIVNDLYRCLRPNNDCTNQIKSLISIGMFWNNSMVLYYDM